MATRIFVTGASGFVGRRLLPALVRDGYKVVALDRSGALRSRLTGADDVEIVAGDLLEPERYRQALSGSDVVLHLAASTGRATEAEHFRAIAQGTEVLLEECHRAGVRKIVFVSSIATKFPDTTHYYYAQAKARAEEAVRRSALQFAILRPTMILGPGSPIQAALEKLALLPVIPVFGSGRTMVQPVHVDDVVEFIVTVLSKDMISNETFDVGGADALSMEELLQRIRHARKGSRGRVLHVPLGLLLPPLRMAEAIGLGGMLPVSVGQLSSFRYDGTVAANALFESRRTQLLDLSRMLVPGAAVAPGLPSAAAAPGVTVATQPLDLECRVFTRHLLGCQPDAYVIRKYAEAHAVSAVLPAADAFDTYLLGFARTHRLLTMLADSYASVFARGSSLRRKLVLLLAILETCPPFYRTIDAAVGGHRALVFARLTWRGGVAVVSLLIGTILFVPARLAIAVVGRRTA